MNLLSTVRPSWIGWAKSGPWSTDIRNYIIQNYSQNLHVSKSCNNLCKCNNYATPFVHNGHNYALAIIYELHISMNMVRSTFILRMHFCVHVDILAYANI